MKVAKTKKVLSVEQRDELLNKLSERFEKNMIRHKGLVWALVQAKLEANPAKLWSLNEMERTGGEPDVVGYDKKTGEFVFFDCSTESPKGRTSVCYDREGLESRKEHKPANNAIDMAAAMRIELLTEEQYRELQTLGEFDLKTSSWLQTPADIRKLGGAIFGDRSARTEFRSNHLVPITFAVEVPSRICVLLAFVNRAGNGIGLYFGTVLAFDPCGYHSDGLRKPVHWTHTSPPTDCLAPRWWPDFQSHRLGQSPALHGISSNQSAHRDLPLHFPALDIQITCGCRG